MSILSKSKRLPKELSLLNVYAIATGATLSSGFFLLPGLAASQAGSAITLAYLFAALLLVPAMLSKAELCTAMPRAGGVYFFLDRSMGPLMGTIGGFGTWIALILKAAFALVGMGAYVTLFLPGLPMTPCAVIFALIFGTINLFGAKKTGGLQIILVLSLLAILAWFLTHGVILTDTRNFDDINDTGMDSIFATAAMVFISYVGITKIASVSEEVKNPERNLPLAMCLSLGTAVIVYGLGTFVMVGVLGSDLATGGDNGKHLLTPVAATAQKLAGNTGALIMTIAAVLAFFSVANAGILSASRYPLAMSRDRLIPPMFRELKDGTPIAAICLTIALTVLCLLCFDPLKIAKLASAFQLFLFALNCLVVIIMRESRIESYDPGFRSPLYPWIQIIGMIGPLWLITMLGVWSMLFIVGLVALGSAWYFCYAKGKVSNPGGAILHLFARLGERRSDGLERELRGILTEKGLRADDPFDVLVAQACVIDNEEADYEQIVHLAVDHITDQADIDRDLLLQHFLQSDRGVTPVSNGVALPHFRLHDLQRPILVMARALHGVNVAGNADDPEDSAVFAIFFLVSPDNDAGQHLRILASIAGQADTDTFISEWLAASNAQELKGIFMRTGNCITFRLKPDDKTAEWIGRAIKDIQLPDDCLIAAIHRRDSMIVPHGDTVLDENDRVTVIGESPGLKQLREQFEGGRDRPGFYAAEKGS